MLLYDSTRPDSDLLSGESLEPRDQAAAELLSSITKNHYRNVASCFQQLEEARIFLGNGGFLVATAFWQQDRVFLSEHRDALRPLISACKAVIRSPLCYCYTCSGHIYFLLCYPRATEEGSGSAPAVRQAMEWFTALHDLTAQTYPGIHFLLSDLSLGERSIYLISNSLSHAKEYYIFRAQVPPVIQVDLESQLHRAFIRDFDAYRQLAIQVADLIVLDRCDTADLCRMAADEILGQCIPSMESLHHHVQMFILTLTDYLGSTGIVDSAYMSRHRIVYRVMAFESESDFRATLFTLLDELRGRFLILRTAGKQHRIVSVREYVDAHAVCPELSVTHIADVFSVNPSILTKQFRHYFGCTLHRYIQQQRLRAAQRSMSEHPGKSLSEIAQESGYTDISTMYRMFRKLEGTTPGSYRNSMQCSRTPRPEDLGPGPA